MFVAMNGVLGVGSWGLGRGMRVSGVSDCEGVRCEGGMGDRRFEWYGVWAVEWEINKASLVMFVWLHER